MSESAGRDDRVAASLGVVAGGVVLAGAGIPFVDAGVPLVGDGSRAGATDGGLVLAASVAFAVVVIATFLARRYDLVSRRIGSPIAAAGGLAVALWGTYGLNQDVTHGVAVPGLGSVPALLFAVVGGGLVIAAAAADYAGVSGRGLARRTGATMAFSAIGAVSFVSIAVWFVVLDLVAILSTGTPIQEFSPPDQILASQAATVLGVGTVAVGFLVATDREWSFVDLRVPTVRDLGYVVGGFVLLVGAALLLDAIISTTGAESATHSSFDRAEENPEILLVLVPASILVIGPFEELLYRNVIQKSLYEYFSRTGAIAVASVPFAVVHFSAYWGGDVGHSLVSLGIVLSLSLILGTVYARTDNLLVPAFVHGLYNALVFGMAYVTMVS